jgi:predicted DNA-binding protein
MVKIRTVVYLAPEVSEALKKLSSKSGAPVGELVRRAVVEYLKKAKG